MKTTTTTTTRAAAAEAARLADLRATETARRAASALRRLRETSAEAVRALRAADLDRLAAEIETAEAVAGISAAAAREARAEYLAARSALRAADLPALRAIRSEAVADLVAASVSRAIDRREAETGRDGRAIRARYARVNVTMTETMDADAIGEAAAVLLEMTAPGGWIDGEAVTMTARETGEAVTVARADLPLAYVAAIAAGRGLDRVMYADGGHAVKMTAREAREGYARAAAEAVKARARLEAAGETVPEHVARLAAMHEAGEVADLLAAEAAARPDDREAARAAKVARAEYLAASAAVAHGMTPTETRRTVDPVAPGPEAAAIMAERVTEILAAVTPAYRAVAIALAREVYRGAMTADGLANVAEAARLAGIPERKARRAWEAVKAAAAETAEAERETAAAMTRAARNDGRRHAVALFRESMGEAARLADLSARAAETESDPAPETVAAWRETARLARPERLAETARMTPADLAALAALARAIFTEAATR